MNDNEFRKMVFKLMTNDIPHINERLARLETGQKWALGLGAAILSVSLGALVVLVLSIV